MYRAPKRIFQYGFDLGVIWDTYIKVSFTKPIALSIFHVLINYYQLWEISDSIVQKGLKTNESPISRDKRGTSLYLPLYWLHLASLARPRPTN